MDDDRRVTTWWSLPREWRRHRLQTESYWVEEEVLVLVGPRLVDQLSWPEPLAADERASYDQALVLKAQLAV